MKYFLSNSFFKKVGEKMENMYKGMLVLTALGLIGNACAAAGRDVATEGKIVLCINNAENNSCQVNLGSVGDERVFTPKNQLYPAKFRSISVTKSDIVKLAAPTLTKGVGIEVTFSAGKEANKALQFIGIVETESGDNNTTVLKYIFYRRKMNAKNNIWYEIGTITAPKSLQEIECFFTVDGLIVFINPDLTLNYIRATE